MNYFSEKFHERLRHIIPKMWLEVCQESFRKQKVQSVRINTLKGKRALLVRHMRERTLAFQEVSWLPDGFYTSEFDEDHKEEIFSLMGEGFLYKQNLSSQLVVCLLNPQPEERNLDLCAAPGGKTTQMAAHMNNTGEIVAIEAIKKRYYKLKQVVALLGARNVKCLCLDGRKYRAKDGLFDRILVDAPCSCEGRFSLLKPETFAYWSERKIKEMARKQKGLLLNAGRLLKPGGILVYATCTFAPEENEAVIDWFLRKTQGRFRLQPVALPDEGLITYPAVLQWRQRSFEKQVRHCLRLLPTKIMEGFFVAKLKRIA